MSASAGRRTRPVGGRTSDAPAGPGRRQFGRFPFPLGAAFDVGAFDWGGRA